MLDWNDLKTFAAVAHAGSINAASKVLGQHPTTVARRLTAAEKALGTPLFLRSARRSELTAAGKRLQERLGSLVATMDGIASTVDDESTAPVRIAVTENGARVFVTAVLPAFAAAGLDVELVGSNKTLDLSKGEADLAIRLVAPVDEDLIRRRIGTVTHGLYGRRGGAGRAPAVSADLNDETILLPTGVLAGGPEARFLAEHAARARVALRADSHITIALAAEAGHGLCVLPHNIARFHAGLVLLRALDEIPGRPMWLVFHRSQRGNQRIRRAATIAVRELTAFHAAA